MFLYFEMNLRDTIMTLLGRCGESAFFVDPKGINHIFNDYKLHKLTFYWMIM